MSEQLSPDALARIIRTGTLNPPPAAPAAAEVWISPDALALVLVLPDPWPTAAEIMDREG
jgi:hypothetical protein